MVNKVEIPTKTFPANQNTALLENGPTAKPGITDKSISSCKYCMIKIPTIATIWLTVFALPQIFAAITSPVLTAIKRIEVTINSRAMIIRTNQSSARPKFTKHTNAEMTNILSASGSKTYQNS